MNDTAARLAAIRGAAKALTLTDMDITATAKGIELAAIDYEASHLPSGGMGASSGPSDPTGSAAMRPKPQNPIEHVEAARAAIRVLLDFQRWAGVMRIHGNPDPNSRPETGAPCRGGQTHIANPEGRRCNLQACGKQWPCRPEQPDYWWEPCPGILTTTADRCPRCELKRGHWVCRDCPTGADVHDRTTRSYLGLCRPHYDRTREDER